jgi:transcriptional regulator with XRE-family HTH domain
VGLHTGTLAAPALTSEGAAAVLRFERELATYMVARTPDPRRTRVATRPIPAAPVRKALKDAGYATTGTPRTVDGATHESLAVRTGIDRRTISRICSTRKNLTLNEAEAILTAIGRDELYRALVEPVVDQTAAINDWVEEELEPIYARLWMGRAALPWEEQLALSDLRWLYDEWQNDAALARLPYAKRREATLERFIARQERQPHRIPATLRKRAEESLAAQRKRYIEDEDRVAKEIGNPERITAAAVRDLKRRALAYGLLENPPVRPAAYQPNAA